MTRAEEPGVALYRQVAQDLVARVDRSELATGRAVGVRGGAAHHYGVNRLTVRRALEELARAGIVRTEHGVGSFIAEPAVRHRIDDGEASLSESMARRGSRSAIASSRSPRWSPRASSSASSATSRTSRGRSVRCRSRRHLRRPGWDGSISVFAAMSAEHAITIKRAETAFGAALAGPDEAGWLEVPVGSALLEVRGFNTDQEGRVVASFAHRIRGDRAEYVVRLPQ